jgi:hypothetical protein
MDLAVGRIGLLFVTVTSEEIAHAPARQSFRNRGIHDML